MHFLGKARSKPIIAEKLRGIYEDGVVQGTVGIEDEHPSFTLPPRFDVLADQVFKKLGLAGAGTAADVPE